MHFSYARPQVVFAEAGLNWGVYELETADHQFECQRLHLEGYDMTPSQMCHRQCYLVGWYDRYLARNCQGVLADERTMILWSNAAQL